MESYGVSLHPLLDAEAVTQVVSSATNHVATWSSTTRTIIAVLSTFVFVYSVSSLCEALFNKIMLQMPRCLQDAYRYCVLFSEFFSAKVQEWVHMFVLLVFQILWACLGLLVVAVVCVGLLSIQEHAYDVFVGLDW